MTFSLKRAATLAILSVILVAGYALLTGQSLTSRNIINVIILALVVDIVVTLLEKNRKR